MPRFFTREISGGHALITGDDALHISKSLRMRPGEAVTLCDGEGLDYFGEITAISPGSVEVKILSTEPSRGEPAVRITLYQALPKADKLDFIVQKAVELGAAGIVPVLTSRCISRPDAKAMEKKREKLAKTSLEAAKQAGRGVIPAIGPLMDFPAALRAMREAELALFCYEQAKKPLREVLGGTKPRSAALLIGSEGGFSPEEAATAQAQGVAPVSLGTRILRCETAPIAAVAALLYALGEM